MRGGHSRRRKGGAEVGRGRHQAPCSFQNIGSCRSGTAGPEIKMDSLADILYWSGLGVQAGEEVGEEI